MKCFPEKKDLKTERKEVGICFFLCYWKTFNQKGFKQNCSNKQNCLVAYDHFVFFCFNVQNPTQFYKQCKS